MEKGEWPGSDWFFINWEDGLSFFGPFLEFRVKAKPMHSVVTFNKQLKIMLLTNLPHLRLSGPQHGCKEKNKYTSLNFVGPQSKATEHIQILPLP